MKKYKVTIFTTSQDLSPEFYCDEFMLEEFLTFGEEEFIKVEDDTHDISCILNKSQIVGIEWVEVC